MMNEISIEGRTDEQTTGPYGSEGCKATLHVTIDGEDVYVPFDGVKRSAYDYHGDVPETVDVDRIILCNGNIHAEADTEGGFVELTPDYNTATAEFKGYDSWELHAFDEGTTQDGDVVWEREEVDDE